MPRAVLIFCEGNHDVVFVSRSLGALAQCKWVDRPIRELPSPLGPKIDPRDQTKTVFDSLITTHYRTQTLEDLRPRHAAHAPLPIFETIVEDPAGSVYYVIIRCNGDGASERSIKLIDNFHNLFIFRPDIDRIASAFLFDADTAGVTARAGSFSAAYSRCLPPNTNARPEVWLTGPYGAAGLFVFYTPPSEEGTLEDSLAPLVQRQWPDRWNAAGEYLTAYAHPDDPVSRKAAEKLKAQISITGQFMFPGDPMTTVLGRDGLEKTHFTGPMSKRLVKFLRDAPF